MVYENPEDRPVSQDPCHYWEGTFCAAVSKYSIEDISCYNLGNCNGFGTCRGCSQYDQGGLKVHTSDGDGGIGQTPMNVRLYNLRAQLAPCCNWGSSPEDVESVGATACSVAAASGWQSSFTEDNPTAYPCNGAKPECPYYTGPKFTEVVDAKMDTGNRVTAKQIMEMRYYSRDWQNEADPRETWESVFSEPDIWAWVRDESSEENTPGPGKYDSNGSPQIQKVTINTFGTDTPTFFVGSPQSIATGSPVIGGPPDYPTFVREVQLLAADRLDVVWPKGTTSSNPLVRKTFTPADAVIQVSVLVHSDNELVAINLTKHPQYGMPDGEFIAAVRREDPDGVISSVVGGLPGANFTVPLEYGGSTSCVNHIKVFLAGGETGTDYITRDIYVHHKFYHAHVAQTQFHDLYGHTMVDPWINHFTRITATAEVLHLTGNTVLGDVFWHTTASNGKKTLYAVETQKEVSSGAEGGEVSWEPLLCGYIAVTFSSPNINRVYPWKAWGEDSKGAALYVKMNRGNNPSLPDGASTEVEMELALASTAGSLLPANVAIFRPADTADLYPFDLEYDTVDVRYAYTEYKQGPIPAGGVIDLKYPEDINKVIETLPYGIEFEGDTISVDGTFVRAGGKKIYTCSDVLGDCYYEKSVPNEEAARDAFYEGGVGEGSVLFQGDMLGECIDEFEGKYSGEFDDGTPVTWNLVADRLADMHLTEGSLHFSIVLKDEEGVPIGVKNTAFLTQSAMVQTRDVEIKYKWAAHAQHWPIDNSMFLLARMSEPVKPTSAAGLRSQYWDYEPYCGDHAENYPGMAQFRAFDLSIDKHGALWYPYTRCQTPQYHPLRWAEKEYEDYVEGFGSLGGMNSTDLRRDYWERMRYFDRYTPAILNYIPQACCCWSKRTTTLDVTGTPTFIGYTKVRSLHPMGIYASDRESLRLSRHWEKRNLEITTETATQGDRFGDYHEWTIELTNEYSEALYDDDGNLRAGSETATPVWAHISDGISVVNVASESMQHPFGNVLLERSGSHAFAETFGEERLALHEVMEERDLTRSTERNPDGTTIYLSDGTSVAEGVVVPGSDIKWVYKNARTAWTWMADPPEPTRAVAPQESEEGDAIPGAIGGLHVSNPSAAIFKKNFRSASHTTEGVHSITYTPHEFNASGGLASAAQISMDGGPPLYISQNTGWVYVLSSEASPYDVTQHEGEDYQFVMHGKGPGGIGILADDRGLQRYEENGTKYATLAGVSINLTFDIDELPYETVSLGGVVDTGVIDALVAEVGEDQPEVISETVSFQGHYYVETVTIDFVQEAGKDIPVIAIGGLVKGETSWRTFFTTSYIRGDSVSASTSVRKTFAVKRRLTDIGISLGARHAGSGMKIEGVDIQVRNHVEHTESIFVYEPRVQVSQGNTGTHKPSSLEFYFERMDPDFSKNYLTGVISVETSIPASRGGVTKLPGTEIKFSTRRVKDLVPIFEFTDLEHTRFPYDNIDFSTITGYTELSTPAGHFSFVGAPVATCSKGWTMFTTDHQDDPSTDLNHSNSYPERLMESSQQALYNDGSELLGDKTAVYRGFWHPEEVEFFEGVGVDLSAYSWTLNLYSTVAPLTRVFRHENYGCIPGATNENYDGTVHSVENWQARGAIHYTGNPGHNNTCLTIVLSKLNDMMFLEYGQGSYFDSPASGRFAYVFGPTDRIDTSPGGRWGGPMLPAYQSIVRPPGPAEGFPGPFTFYTTFMVPKGQAPHEKFD